MGRFDTCTSVYMCKHSITDHCMYELLSVVLQNEQQSNDDI